MRVLLLGALLLSAITNAFSTEFSAIWEHEWAVDSAGHGQKFESTFTPEWNFDISESTSMTFIARGRLDAFDKLGPTVQKTDSYSGINGPLIAGSQGELAIREWYLDSELSFGYLRLGKQQVVWGQADGLKVLDVINPQSYREFILDDFDDSRIPLWTLNLEIPVGEDDSLQVLWIPDTSYNELAEADSTFAVTSPLFIPSLPVNTILVGIGENKPSSFFSDSEFGLRYSLFRDGWDLTLNYLYHFHDTAVLYQNLTPAGVAIESRYERNHLIGATASNAFGDFTLRAEVGYNSDTYHLSTDISERGIHQTDELASVIGLDWQGLEDTMISAQWFQSYLFDHDSDVIRPKNNHMASLLYKQTFQNEVWELEVLALHGFDQDDGVVQTKVSYMYESNIKLYAGNDTFYGDREGLFGQFSTKDRFTFGVEVGF